MWFIVLIVPRKTEDYGEGGKIWHGHSLVSDCVYHCFIIVVTVLSLANAEIF